MHLNFKYINKFKKISLNLSSLDALGIYIYIYIYI